MHPNYLGWQVDWPLFVKREFTARKKTYKPREHFPWAELAVAEDKVAALYNNGFLYHNPELEAEANVGYKLSEFKVYELRKIVEMLNTKVRERTESKEQFNKIRCRGSTNANKQRTLIRRFLHNNPSFEEDYYEIYDFMMDRKSKAVDECGATTTQTSQQTPQAGDSMSSDSSSET